MLLWIYKDFYFVEYKSGNVGIGDTSPNALLDVEQGTAGTDTDIQFRNSDNTNSGSDVTHQILVGGASGGDPVTMYTVENEGIWYVGSDNSDSDSFKVSRSQFGSEFTIDTSGNVGIGTTGPANKLNVIGDINASGCFETATGTLVGGSCVSDIRQKENITPLKNSLNTLSQLRPVSFTWINSTERRIGLIAQEVEEILPEYVETGEDGYKKVKYSVELDIMLI